MLWQHAIGQALSKPFSQCNDHAKVVCKAISLAREGLFGKACQVLTSSGVAPINETTWKLLQAKRFERPLPMLPSGGSRHILGSLKPGNYGHGPIIARF